MLIGMGAAHALVVYPQLARALLGGDGTSPDVVDHYAAQVALVLGHLGPDAPRVAEDDEPGG